VRSRNLNAQPVFAPVRQLGHKKEENEIKRKILPRPISQNIINVRGKLKKGTETETETYSDEGEYDRVHNYHAVKTCF
jgi:hypothetical protein